LARQGKYLWRENIKGFQFFIGTLFDA
jgi:hypothetical protein